MATYVLIPGAGSDSWYWHLVEPRLRALGHDVVAIDLPSDDDAAGFGEYTDAVLQAIGDRRELVLVAQSMGGFTKSYETAWASNPTRWTEATSPPSPTPKTSPSTSNGSEPKCFEQP